MESMLHVPLDSTELAGSTWPPYSAHVVVFLCQFSEDHKIDYCNNQCGKLLVRALPVCMRPQSDIFLYFLYDGNLPWQFYICFVYAFLEWDSHPDMLPSI